MNTQFAVKMEINEAEDTHTGLEPQAHPQINETRNTRRRGRNGIQGMPAGVETRDTRRRLGMNKIEEGCRCGCTGDDELIQTRPTEETVPCACTRCGGARGRCQRRLTPVSAFYQRTEGIVDAITGEVICFSCTPHRDPPYPPICNMVATGPEEPCSCKSWISFLCRAEGCDIVHDTRMVADRHGETLELHPGWRCLYYKAGMYGPEWCLGKARYVHTVALPTGQRNTIVGLSHD